MEKRLYRESVSEAYDAVFDEVKRKLYFALAESLGSDQLLRFDDEWTRGDGLRLIRKTSLYMLGTLAPAIYTSILFENNAIKQFQ